MNKEDSIAREVVVWRPALSNNTVVVDPPPPAVDLPDDSDPSAPIPSPRQTIWPRVWPGL
jgi:hypothetical protein